MEELIKQYAQPLIIIAVVIALIIIFAWLLGDSAGAAGVKEQFTKLIGDFFKNATDIIGKTPTA